MTPNIRILLSAAASAAAILAASPALAQTTDANDPAASTSTDPATIDDIVVTARKRAESLQDVPASIQAIGEVQLERLNAKSLQDLNGVTPSARIDGAGNITIRGIRANARNAGFEASAGVYVDGVYVGRPAGNNQDLVDVAQVEIVRGPQGTLFGKNTTAGAISITTVRPGATWKGSVEAQYGERDDLRVAGYIAGPVSDLVGIKLAAFSRTSDGHQKNIVTGARYGNYDARGVRGEIRLTPGSWDFALRGDYTSDHGTPPGQVAVGGPAAVFSTGMDNVSYNKPYTVERDGGGFSFTAENSLAGGYTLTSISAYRALTTDLQVDGDYSALTFQDYHWVDKSKQFSQELRLASDSTGSFTWLIGGYYFHQQLDTDRPINLTPPFAIVGTLRDVVTTKTNAFAVFANADYHITGALTLNAGLRYTTERKTLAFVQYGIPALGYPNLQLNDRFTDSDVSPTAALSYKFSPQLTAYAKYSKGFKAGGWNPDITSTLNIGFKAENVVNYEVGLRTRLLQNKLGVNLTGYMMDYNDLQVSQFLGTSLGYVITNAGKARVKGVELEVQAQPTSWLSLTAGGAINDAKYVKFETGTGLNFAGRQFVLVPLHTAFVSADVRAPISGNLNLTAHVDYRYQSKEFFDDQRTVFPGIGPAASGPYGLLNGRAGFALGNGVTVEVFGQNLTNKRALTARLYNGLRTALLDSYLPPREVGVRASYKF